ncbi:MAG: SCO family protein [Candidatus Palauibacterales bacterium]|jgi:protein SCO1|nr:SCO family protein [Candidatus Palauibacterales bacterium]
MKRVRRSTGGVAGRAHAIVVFTACLGLLSACRVEAPERSEAEERARTTGYRGILLEDTDPRPDFVLTDARGEAFDFRAETEGKLALLFFGYTFCPDVCPVHMASIAAVKRDLSVEEQRRMSIVFVTVDPERDTPERLREWLSNFDPSFVGLRGTEARVDSIMLGLGLPAAIRDTTAGPDYPVGHASQVIAFPPGDGFRVIYPFGTRQADWKHDLPRLLKK